MLWVVEDAHWIDPTTLELIELALDRIQGDSGFSLLITARPTFVASFASHPVVTRVALNRWRGRQRRPSSPASPEANYFQNVVDEIAARTDGVPLFVEEMTKAVSNPVSCEETTTPITSTAR